MNEKKHSRIVTPNDHEQGLSYLEQLMSKGEENLSAEEIEVIAKTAEVIAEYEQQNMMTPIPKSKALASENDKEKIAAVLGFVPSLIELVEFKMYQLKINQNALAELLKMPASKISQILNKKREPDVSFLKGIHEKLGIDGNYILEAV